MSRFGYVPADTFIHRMNPVLKLLILILLVSVVIIYPSWLLGILFLLAISISFKIAKVPIQLKSGRVRFLLFFSIFLFIIQILVTINGSIIFFLIPEINGIGPILPITDFGVERGIIMTTRFLIVVFSSMLFVSVTDPTLLAHSLTRLKVPYRYSFTLIIALRFLPLFDLENNTVRMAQKSRGLSIELGGIKKLRRSIRYTFFPLIISALSKVESLSISMDGRGFGYADSRTHLRESHWRRLDSVVFALVISLVIGIILLSLGYFPQISAIL